MRAAIRISIAKELKDLCPALHVGALECRVVNSEHDPALWREIDEALSVAASRPIEDIKDDPAIAATRAFYKACGKDPNRYRPAAEQLRRRAAQGKGLYRVNTLVDLVNLVSLKTGLSIGGFDADRIEGDVEWGIGRAGEPYEGIGRGSLNIDGLPVMRDRRGAFGSPTSDSERTKIAAGTVRLFLNINSYAGRADAERALDLALDLLSRHASAGDVLRQIAV